MSASSSPFEWSDEVSSAREKVRIVLVDADGVAPYAERMRRMERDILYPIADGKDQFRIEHGLGYAPFFSDMGNAHFAVALENDEVVGTGVGIIRHALAGGRRVVSGYGCDLKLAVSHRGSGLAKRLVFFGLTEMLRPKNTLFRSWRFAYGAAMRGAKGDVLRSGRGVHPLKLLSPYARLHVYFVDPQVLAGLEADGCPRPPPEIDGLDLSPDAEASSGPLGIVSTAGKKDLRLVSTGAPWPLQHLVLGPRSWNPNLGAYLQASGAAMLAAGAPGPACFALDERLSDHVAWLRARGVEPGATCTIIAWRLWPRLPSFKWVHLATSEI